VVPEFGATLQGEKLIIDKFLYGLKISACIFHEHLSKSLLRLGFKKQSINMIYGWWTVHHIMNTLQRMWMKFLSGARMPWQS
jgi:hypothetical protein